MNRIGKFLSTAAGHASAQARRQAASDTRSPVAILIERLARLTPADAVSAKPRGVRRLWRSAGFALDGWRAAWKSEQNLRLHVYAAVTIVMAGACVGLSIREWLWISLAIGMVFIAELSNTALESVVDLVVGPQRHPLARRAKDISAAVVLCAVAVAAAIGGLVIGPHLIR